jgi:hypothetical protein
MFRVAMHILIRCLISFPVSNTAFQRNVPPHFLPLSADPPSPPPRPPHVTPHPPFLSGVPSLLPQPLLPLNKRQSDGPLPSLRGGEPRHREAVAQRPPGKKLGERSGGGFAAEIDRGAAGGPPGDGPEKGLEADFASFGARLGGEDLVSLRF